MFCCGCLAYIQVIAMKTCGLLAPTEYASPLMYARFILSLLVCLHIHVSTTQVDYFKAYDVNYMHRVTTNVHIHMLRFPRWTSF
jgi:hypothetical protein